MEGMIQQRINGLRVIIIVSATQTVALVTIAIVMKGTRVTHTIHKDAMVPTYNLIKWMKLSLFVLLIYKI